MKDTTSKLAEDLNKLAKIPVGSFKQSPKTKEQIIRENFDAHEANLLLAAPVMYNAIKKFMEAAEKSQDIEFSAIMGMAYCGLRNAIEKAEGVYDGHKQQETLLER